MDILVERRRAFRFLPKSFEIRPIYTVSHKKPTILFVHNFGICWPIFKTCFFFGLYCVYLFYAIKMMMMMMMMISTLPWKHALDSTATVFHVRDPLWVLYFPAKQCQRDERLQPSQMGDTHVYFIKHVVPTPRSKPMTTKCGDKFSSGLEVFT